MLSRYVVFWLIGSIRLWSFSTMLWFTHPIWNTFPIWRWKTSVNWLLFVWITILLLLLGNYNLVISIWRHMVDIEEKTWKYANIQISLNFHFITKRQRTRNFCWRAEWKWALCFIRGDLIKSLIAFILLLLLIYAMIGHFLGATWNALTLLSSLHNMFGNEQITAVININ